MSTAKPEGQPTRGKTAHNRLRRVDNYVLMTDHALIQRHDEHAFFVDVGYGATPITTLESATRLRQMNAQLHILGVEIDPERVALALPFADEHTHFRLGGFNLPLADGEKARIIRAFNVLRQYDEAAVLDAWCSLGQALTPGGLLIEGTSDPYGRIWVANLLRRVENTLRFEGVVFSTNFRWGFEPAIFQPVLPKNLIHRMVPDEPIYAFMEAWKLAARETMSQKTWGLRQWFIAIAIRLAERGYRLDLRRKLLRLGYLLWQDGETHIAL